MQVHYEPHPVSQERKAELRAAGYQILDARFKPAEPEPATEADKPKRGRPAKAEPESKDE